MEANSHFENIREEFCTLEKDVTIGKMMSSEAIHYKGKVFAFFSTKGKMVFKLGKDFKQESIEPPLEVFSPFKSKRPMAGWYQLDAEYKNSWRVFANKALDLIKQQL